MAIVDWTADNQKNRFKKVFKGLSEGIDKQHALSFKYEDFLF